VDGVHDMGGMHGFGAVVEPGSEVAYHEEWEPRVFALHLLVSTERLGAGPGGRATREEMPPAEYLEASYYERWIWSAERRLERSGAIAPGEVDAMMERLRAGADAPRKADAELAERTLVALREVEQLDRAETARFQPGDRVRARRMRPPGHTRCPRYARGVEGRIEHVRVLDSLPDLAVYGRDAPPEPVYSVAFRSDDLWGPGGEPSFTVFLDLWESYLEPA
jgi:nitrile hydratase